MGLYTFIHQHYYIAVFATTTIGGYLTNKLVTAIAEPKRQNKSK